MPPRLPPCRHVQQAQPDDAVAREPGEAVVTVLRRLGPEVPGSSVEFPNCGCKSIARPLAGRVDRKSFINNMVHVVSPLRVRQKHLAGVVLSCPRAGTREK